MPVRVPCCVKNNAWKHISHPLSALFCSKFGVVCVYLARSSFASQAAVHSLPSKHNHSILRLTAGWPWNFPKRENSSDKHGTFQMSAVVFRLKMFSSSCHFLFSSDNLIEAVRRVRRQRRLLHLRCIGTNSQFLKCPRSSLERIIIKVSITMVKCNFTDIFTLHTHVRNYKDLI